MLGGKKYEGAFYAKTDIGSVRISNEDQAKALINAYGDVILIVCDGMGGQNKGDYAAKVAIDHIAECFYKKKGSFHFYTEARTWLNLVLKECNDLIYSESEKNKTYSGMGTTAVVALIFGRRMVIANIGDSRAYSFERYLGLKRLTEDQTYVDYLIKTGQIKEGESSTHPDRHVLMNALGIFPSLSLTLTNFNYRGEAVLLCSDGLYNNMSEQEINMVLDTDDRVDQKVLSLISEANANGGSDNIAIAYWEALHD
ncbi:MAG: Stp1/IreP family PP2C-type Ser/Thr phosphatase [Bacillota bacterium]|nr:Stp1/IreP family PP2C-type Ser/Thr phosphatase [Bacillota bacterium]